MDRIVKVFLLVLGLILANVQAEISAGAVNVEDAAVNVLPICGPVCDIYCEFGNVLDEKGCPTCKCRTQECPLLKCSTNCPAGYVLDKNGCRTCACIPECPAIKCAACRAPLIAETIRDSLTGCPIGCRCKCPTVARPRCISPKRIECQFDAATNCTSGCTCVCPPPPPCAVCPYGSYPQPSSVCFQCPVCRPKPECPSVKCSHDCPHGYKKDANGCKTCNCTCLDIDCAPCPEPQITQIVTDPVTGCSTGCRCECPVIDCAPCPEPQITQIVTDPVTGCSTGCRCECPVIDCAPCPEPQITQIVTDRDTGCSTGCGCATPPKCPLSCEIIKCPAEQLITFTDDNGCRKCRCNPLCGRAGQAASDAYGCIETLKGV